MSWQSAMIPGFGPERKPILSVLAKRTYEIAPGRTVLADDQLPLNPAEIQSDPANPFYSETIAESDLIAYKPFTDVVILGKAYAPHGKKAYHLECEARIGSMVKRLVVYGERKIESKLMRGPCFTDPVAFESKDIGYRSSFGGRAKSKDGTLYPFPPNPLGIGFYLKGGFEDYSEIIVPDVEDPDSPIEPAHLILDKFDDWKTAPKPASFGWTKQNFFPRFTYAGIIPELPGAFAAGYEINPTLPKMDMRFFQGASEGLCNQVLMGNEHVKLTYLDPQNPVFEFDLPGERPYIQLKSNGDKFNLDASLQTVLIDKNDGLLSLVWRGSKVYENMDDLVAGLVAYEIT